MNNYFNKIFRIKNYFSLSHYYNEKDGLSTLAKKQSTARIANVCLVERDAYWHTQKAYSNVNAFELMKLIKVEIRHIAPFDGDVYWQLEKLSFDSAVVNYFVIPRNVVDVIKPSCQFIYPESINSQKNSLLLTNNSVSKPQVLNESIEAVENSNIFTLIGFFCKRVHKETTAIQKLTTKLLLMLSSISVGLFVLISSAYLSFMQSYYQSETASNVDAVNHALNVQKEIKSRFESKQEFDKFFVDNRNVLALFSQLDLQGQEYEITRVYLHPKGFKLTGTTKKSATDILALLIQSPLVSEAKFSRPVSKNRRGDEIFVIEVEFS